MLTAAATPGTLDGIAAAVDRVVQPVTERVSAARQAGSGSALSSTFPVSVAAKGFSAPKG